MLLASALIAGTAVVPGIATAAPAESSMRLTVESKVLTANKRGELTCQPAGGTHKNASKACEELEKVNGNVSAMQANVSKVCTMEYQPVTAKIEGKWRGKEISYSQTFSNSCTLQVKTGVVFDL
ncbi:protease inhibitor [Saccharopolyspora rhizosphaerae]|uniref:Protease inhibitor n=1 Tax=Saccharopolyspora rhizosphaerae TaxID=2492662 RepID=A0A426JKB6_9PSEU|nr:SSI family serine proteinase inhibitor [Saccharopolyspora rhizosphaerae]RRO13648.1 protease inhibitor [Saccharopolyspora rhizosphaerae]